jgi:hypothetical protein
LCNLTSSSWFCSYSSFSSFSTGRIAAREYYEKREDETREDASKQLQRVFRGYKDKKLVAGMHKQVKKVDKTFFQTRGASENTLYRKRNFLATGEKFWNYSIFLQFKTAVTNDCLTDVWEHFNRRRRGIINVKW